MNLLGDMRFAARQMRRSPAVTLTAVLSMGLGIGAATSIFSVIHGVVLDPFPYRDVDTLMSVKVWNPGQRGYRTHYTVDQYLEIASRSTIFNGVTVSTISDVEWTGGEEPRRLRGNHTTFDGLEIMGVPAMIGRIFTKADEEIRTGQVCVLGARFWRTEFAADPNVIGRTLVLDGRARTVVGVMPPRFMWRGADVYLPVPFRRGQPEEGVRYVHVLGRLKPGVTEAQAEGDLRPIVEELRRREPAQFPETFRVGLLSFAETFPSGIRDTLWLLLAAVGLLVLIACANVSSLLLSNGMRRAREMAVRAAIGAGRRRLIRQLLTESTALGLAGGLLGVLFAWAGTRAVLALAPPFTIPDESEVRIHLPVLAFTLALSLLTALVFGLAPALQASRTDLARALAEGGRGSGGGRRQSLLRGIIVTVEIGLAVVLLAGAGLMARTMLAVEAVDLGVGTDRLLTLVVPLSNTRYPSPARRSQFMEELLVRLAASPGVEAAAVNSWFHPLGNSSAPVVVPGSANQDDRRVVIHPVSARYLDVYRIPLLAGRFLNETDVNAKRRVAVVSGRFVKRFFPGAEPVGRIVRIPMAKQPPVNLPDDAFEIVGVAGDTMAGDYREPPPELYFPHTVAALSNCLTVRAASPNPFSALPAVRAAVRELDPDQPVTDAKTLEARLSDRFLAGRRFNAVLFGVFAAMGLALSLVGIYGVLAHSVSSRTREIGVRVALGASAGRVRRLVLGQGARLTLIGLALGLGGNLLASRLLKQLIWNVRPLDPVSITAVALVLGAAALAACALPARRAARIDPVKALRFD